MNKQDFLNSLRAALGGELPANVVESNVRYYEEYINSEIRMGKSEAEVLNMLGNPKLIARSIIEAERNSEEGRNGAAGDYGQNAGYRSGNDYTGYHSAGNGNRMKVQKMPLWLIVLLVVAVICVVFGLLVMFVWWLAPIIIVVWIFGFVIKILRGKK